MSENDNEFERWWEQNWSHCCGMTLPKPIARIGYHARDAEIDRLNARWDAQQKKIATLAEYMVNTLKVD